MNETEERMNECVRKREGGMNKTEERTSYADLNEMNDTERK